MNPIVFALLSLVCAAGNDFLFKLYMKRPRPVGLYVALIGFIWAGAFMAVSYPHLWPRSDGVTLKWGFWSGLFSACSNLILINVLAHQEVGVCATIYRLNLAPAALLAFLLLGEQVTLLKVTAISAAIVAVLMFMPKSGTRLTENRPAFFWLIVAASLLRAGMGVSYKWGLTCGADALQMLSINGIVWFAAGLGYHQVVERRTVSLTKTTCTYGCISGVLVCGIVLFMMLALKGGEASTVLPITQLSFLLTGLLGVMILHESLTCRKAVGFGLAVLCIVLMAVGG